MVPGGPQQEPRLGLRWSPGSSRCLVLEGPLRLPQLKPCGCSKFGPLCDLCSADPARVESRVRSQSQQRRLVSGSSKDTKLKQANKSTGEVAVLGLNWGRVFP